MKNLIFSIIFILSVPSIVVSVTKNFNKVTTNVEKKFNVDLTADGTIKISKLKEDGNVDQIWGNQGFIQLEGFDFKPKVIYRVFLDYLGRLNLFGDAFKDNKIVGFIIRLNNNGTLDTSLEGTGVSTQKL